MDAEICRELINNETTMESLQNCLKTYKVCLTAVQVYGYNLKYVPEDKKTRELCMTAVKSISSSLEFVPANLKDYEMCTIAVKNNGWSIKHVPLEIMDKEMILLAVNQCGTIIHIIPKEKMDIDICITALGNLNEYTCYKNYYMEQFVPKQLHEEVEKRLEVSIFDKYCNLVKVDISHINNVPRHMVPSILEKIDNKIPTNFDFDVFNGCVFTGKQFKQLIGDRKLYKFTNENEQHQGMKYKTGENKDVLKFNPTGECSMGGLYFTEEKHANYWGRGNSWCRRVSLSDDALIYVENKKFKADKIILGERSLF
jgi:hypothetical protein